MPPPTAHAQRSCPLTPSQDSVCGCPAFWAPAPPPMDEPSTPPGPARETCFFWYHNTCRRGERCHLAHEAHATWPVVAPPGFLHYEKCKLAMCPLRWDVVASEGKGVEADQTDVFGKGEQRGMETGVVEGLVDPSSRAMNGAYGSGSGSGSESGDEVALSLLDDRATTSPRADGADSTPLARSHPRAMSSLPSTVTSMSTPSFAPNGPRITAPSRPSAATQICFKWYHSQPCSRRGGRKCRYAHAISEHGGEVSLPLGIRGHRGCALELCPLREDLRAPEAKVERKKAKAKAKKVKGADVSIAGRGGRSAPEKQRSRGETEQETLEMRRRVLSERKERKTRRRMERRWEGMTLDYGDGVQGKQGGDGRLSDSDGVGRWDVVVRQKVQPRVLVDYELPEGEERLEWDTDLVRRTFGEIE